MKIHVLATDGSPLGVTCKTIYGEDGRVGCGGAELGILTLLEGWHNQGHEVVFFNNPKIPNGSPFEHRAISSFRPKDERDVLIVFRSPNPFSYAAKGYKVWLSNDQRTIGDFRSFAKTVNKIVTISPFHSEFFRSEYGIQNAIDIDIPVRLDDYDREINKVARRCIFTSVPDRGVMPLNAAWPRIVQRVPDASLVITSDWRLWTENATSEDIRRYQQAFRHHKNVQYLGAVNRRKLIDIQLSADLHIYPCTYDELFCISVAESQVSGAYPITSGMGALSTTNMGEVIQGNPTDPRWVDAFVDKVVQYLTDDFLADKQKALRQSALNRFSIDTVLSKWNSLIFNEI